MIGLGTFHLVIKWTLVLCFLVFCIHYWLLKKTYLTSDTEIAKISEKYVGCQIWDAGRMWHVQIIQPTFGQDVKKAYSMITRDLQQAFPGHILGEEDQRWLFMNAGGWMGSVCILHASLTEYILFFGTAINTSGNSGRYWANISDTILTGSFRQWKEGDLKSTIHKPGDTVLHVWGEVTAVEWEADTWMVEYARGFIPSTLGFALADTLFSTTDLVNLFNILRIYTKALQLELFAYLFEWREYIKESL